MKSLLGKKLADSVGSAGSMILFLIFASCSLIMIAAGASTYARIAGSFDKTFNYSAAAKYVTNKIRSGDSSTIETGGKAVSISFGDTVCVITSEKDGITEINRRAQDETNAQLGDVIFPGAGMDISERGDGLYSVTISSGGESITVYCRSKG